MNVLIVDRQLPFEEIAAKLQAGGWQREADPTAPPPIIAGEPESAEFVRSDLRLHYQFEPATGLRALRIAGPRGGDELAALSSQLPYESVARARELLRAPESASRLLGLQMIDALAARELLGETAALVRDPDATVARLATQICARVLAKPLSAALHTLGHWASENPDKSSIFLLLGNVRDKLQVLRWIWQGRDASNEHIDAVLRTALEDADWEVRMTAIVVAARLRAGKLVAEIARAGLPQETDEGVNGDERKMLRTFKVYTIELLEGAVIPLRAEVPPTTRETMHDHLIRCLAGEPVAFEEKAFLWLTSLRTPLPAEPPQPAVLPAGVVRAESGFVLEGRGIPLCWVPPVQHWLGEELERMRVPNPIRRAKSAGFFIARENWEDAAQCSFEQAVVACRALAQETGLEVRLPTADEWEMAARGPDARRFPWGNSAASEARFGPSPWGVLDAVARRTQWTSTAIGEDALVCGGERQWVCAMRMPAPRGSLHAVRFVVGM